MNKNFVSLGERKKKTAELCKSKTMISIQVLFCLSFFAALVFANPFGSGTCYARAEDITMGRSKKPSDNGGYTLTASVTSYAANSGVTVTLSGGTKRFAGVLLYAENEANQRVGSWSLGAYGLQHLANCPGALEATVTHSA
jgi:hypothetical protein